MKVLIVFIIFILLLPYVRFMYKRFNLYYSLKTKLGKNTRLVPTQFMWFFGLSINSNCDFYIETKFTIYSVKLFQVLKPSLTVVFKENGTYFNRHCHPVAFGSFYYTDGVPKSVKNYNFRYNFKSEWEIKTPKNILLFNPTCKEVVYRKKNGLEHILGSGDVINGMYIYSLSRFLGELEFRDATENF